MAWQLKIRYTGAPADESVLKVGDGTLGSDLQKLFNDNVVAGNILNQSREVVDATTKIDTIIYKDQTAYDNYRSGIDGIINGDDTKYSNQTVEVLEQKEVSWP